MDYKEMSNEELVALIQRDKSHEKGGIDGDERAAVLFDKVGNLIGHIVSKYVKDPNEKCDVEQKCVSRIWSRIGQYDEKLSKFSTWLWRVCSSQAINHCKFERKQTDRYVTIESSVFDYVIETDEELNIFTSNQSCRFIREEIKAATADLIKKYPKKKGFIVEMLGDPNSDHYYPPTSINVVASGREVGIGRGTSSKFFLNKVRPFFKRRFGSNMQEVFNGRR